MQVKKINKKIRDVKPPCFIPIQFSPTFEIDLKIL